MDDNATQANKAPNRPPVAVLDYAPVVKGKGSPVGWILAFVCYPFGTIVYLACLGALGWARASSLIAVAALVFAVLVPVAAHDAQWDEKPHWALHVMLLTLYCLGTLQYIAGERFGVWSAQGRQLWHAAACFAGLMFLFSLLDIWAAYNLNLGR
jgi:hypothetical protein